MPFVCTDLKIILIGVLKTGCLFFSFLPLPMSLTRLTFKKVSYLSVNVPYMSGNKFYSVGSRANQTKKIMKKNHESLSPVRGFAILFTCQVINYLKPTCHSTVTRKPEASPEALTVNRRDP